VAEVQGHPTSVANNRDRRGHEQNETGLYRKGNAAYDSKIMFGKAAACDTTYDRVRICLRHDSLVIFEALAGLTSSTVSAGASARAGYG
jgi:hypothetical protein